MSSRTLAFLTLAALLFLALVPAIEAFGPVHEESTKTVAADSETIVYVTKTGEKYHLGSCRYLSRSKIKITLKEAKRKGYTPCKVCKPPA